MKIEEFLNTKLVNYASYDNLRKIASCIDGCKNASRKVLYTVHEKKIKDKLKVLQLANKAAEFSDYLHGDLSGVVVTLGQDFAGTNNLPMLKKSGSFGTRSVHDSAAPRYIFAQGSEEFFNIFKYVDDDILELQVFEGNKIEPRFYLPTLPMLLINGSEGISEGYAQKILPRDANNIKKYLTQYLKGQKTNSKLLMPSVNGFTGNIERDLESPENTKKFLVKGVVEIVSKTEVLVKDIPYQYDLQQYLKVLDDLQDTKKILRYKDESDGENILQFRVYFPRNTVLTQENVLSILKLVKPVTENYICISENNQIIDYFQSAEDIIKYYIDVKKRYLQKRKEFLVQKYESELQILKSKEMFINLCINSNIEINNKNKALIVQQLEKFNDIIKLNDSYDYLLNMPIYSLTSERLDSLKKSITELTEKLNNTKDISIEQMWLNDIAEI